VSHPLIRAVLVLAILFPATATPSAEPAAEKANPFAAIDRHALDAPAEAEASLATLAKYLAEPCKTEQEKARAVYRWVTDRVAYDVEALIARKVPDGTPTVVLRRRKAFCDGYANLYADLAARAGLKVRKVDGWMKNPSIGGPHSWNAAEIDGNWRLLDATCGAGGILGDKFEKGFREYYFFTPPASLVFTHLPKDPRMQLLEKPVTAAEFKAQPVANAVLFEMGVPPKAMRAAAAEKGFREFVRAFNHPGPRTSVVNVPLSLHLQAGTEYTFELKSEDYDNLAFVNEGKITRLEKTGTTFRVTFAPRRGKLILGGAPPGTKSFAFILEYAVED
jgi:hypothetical protein